MGVLSELVIADEEEAQAIAECDSPSRDWHGIVWKTLDPIKLGTLWGILKDTTDDASTNRLIDDIQLLHEASPDGPWVFGIPPQLRDLLAGLAREDPSAIARVAESWSTTDELRDWDYSDVRDLLQQVADLADSARLEGKRVLLWTSL